MNVYGVSDLTKIFESIKEKQRRHKFIRVFVKVGKDRSSEQNRMFYSIYGCIGDQLYGGDINQAKSECKLHYGIPILGREDEEYLKLYKEKVKPFSYEQQLSFMLPPFEYPVTSKMSVIQGRKYIDLIMNEFAARGVDFSEIDQ